MLNLKKTAVAVLALGSSTVFAGTMGPVCTPGNVTVPCEKNAWTFGVQALYLKPVNDNYGGFSRTINSDSSVSDTYNNVDGRWGWGYKLEGHYHFNSGNDITINWHHMDRKNTRNFGIYNEEYVDGKLVGTNNPTTTRVHPRWDQVNFEVGQHVDFGEQKSIRFHGGAQYSNIRQNINTTVLKDPNDYTSMASNAARIKFNGFGPRIGSDLSYDLANGLTVYAKGASALLVGRSKFKDSIGLVAAQQRVNSLTVTNYSKGSRDIMVPELDGKLGANYTYAMPQGDVSLDVGYMWVHYFNAQQFGSDKANFSLNGPYAGLKWVGNV